MVVVIVYKEESKEKGVYPYQWDDTKGPKHTSKDTENYSLRATACGEPEFGIAGFQ